MLAGSSAISKIWIRVNKTKVYRQLLNNRTPNVELVYRKKILEAEEASGEFELDLTVYEDENCSTPLGSGEVLIPNYIYAKVHLVNEDDPTLYVQVCSLH